MGHLLARNGDLVGSKSYFRAALDMAPNNEDAMFCLTVTLERLNEVDQISPLYARFKAAGGTSICLHKRVGEIMLATGDLTTAEAAFQTAIAADPADAGARVGLAKVGARMADAEMAAQ